MNSNFKSLKNCKRHKGNFTLKSNSTKIMLFSIRFQSNTFIFKSLYNFLSELNNIFHLLFVSNQLTIGERPNKKNIESLDLS